MAAIQFPSNPVLDQLYTSDDGDTWKWSGYAWVSQNSYNGPQKYTSTTGITAFAGGGATSATQLTTAYNRVTVVATDLDSIKMLSAEVGVRVVIINSDSDQTVRVFPSTGQNFEGLAENVGYDLLAGTSMEAFCFTAGTWILF